MDCVLFCVLAKIIRYRGDSAKLFVTQRESPGEESLSVARRKGKNRYCINTPSEKRNVGKMH